MKSSKIKCILFDVGGVLQLIKGRGMKHHQYMMKKLGFEEKSYFKAMNPIIWDSTTGIITKTTNAPETTKTIMLIVRVILSHFFIRFNLNFIILKSL